MVDDTVECVSVEGHAAAVEDAERKQQWAGRYVHKYAEVNLEFVLSHLIVEFVPDRAIAVIEREDEFATRPTRWVF
jgi:hypothetical protein